MVSNVRSFISTKKIGAITKKKQKLKISKSLTNNLPPNPRNDDVKPATENKEELTQSAASLAERYPILKDEELVKKFLNIPMTNNQKGRIRQQLRDQLKDTADILLPDVIHNRIQAVIKNSKNLTEPELRKIRILYNMLKTAVEAEKKSKMVKDKKNKDKNVEKKTQIDKDGNQITKLKDSKIKDDNEIAGDKIKTAIMEQKEVVENKKDKEKKEDGVKTNNKIKGPKRYVVFIGNLPIDVTKDMIMNHFWELNENIVSVRIPKRDDAKKSSIAYVELRNEPSYELALSKNHSMMGSKRINVQYTTQTKSKITKTEAKSKTAKLIALQKSGKLAGSLPANKKRSHRRAIAKRAQAKLAAASQ